MIVRRKVNKKLIGLFTIISVIILIGVLSILLSNKLFIKKNNLFVLYFEESIQNLNIGSPVMFRGVEIGKVAKIDLVMDQQTLNFNIPVYISIDVDSIFKTTDYKKFEDKKLLVDKLISKGLKAKLNTYSIITGQLMIELEILPDVEIVNRNKFANKNILEIPTVLSSKSELSKGFQKLPIKDILEKTNYLLDNINKYVPKILEETVNFSIKLNEININGSNELSDTFNNLNKTLNNIAEAAKSLHNFLDYLERHPESLIKGKIDY